MDGMVCLFVLLEERVSFHTQSQSHSFRCLNSKISLYGGTQVLLNMLEDMNISILFHHAHSKQRSDECKFTGTHCFLGADY